MSEGEASIQAAIKIMQAIHELHNRGYERLRLAPGMSPSGCNWRCTLAPKSNIKASHGAMLADFDGPVIHGSINGEGGGYNGIEFSEFDSPSLLADAISLAFPELIELSRGEDTEYVQWYSQMLQYAQRGLMPIAYADWYEKPDPRFMPFWNGESDLPMPPPGEAQESEEPDA